ncbi:Uncharacterized protein ycf39 [Apostasia shenzhenica]|uniref:Uncharacterized protein ycf39 n=1 Tax=Apostasia shenzhenica TaxID=1088818 RepID=A0A2H9ZX18_9ASPA|nr:Uncharacterized protein ycf39 [Apostasia shenzhenica]
MLRMMQNPDGLVVNRELQVFRILPYPTSTARIRAELSKIPLGTGSFKLQASSFKPMASRLSSPPRHPSFDRRLYQRRRAYFSNSSWGRQDLGPHPSPSPSLGISNHRYCPIVSSSSDARLGFPFDRFFSLLNFFAGRFCLPLRVRCSAQTVVATDISQGTPVRPTSVLVVGATGTLGRQIVRRALDEGYDVRCLVRPRPAPADFLRDWGATVVNGDLSKPETLPATLVGIHTVVDCATGRPEEPIHKVDWEGKVALIQCAKAMGIQKYVFYSIHNCDKHPEVPLMEIKYCTEKFLQDSGLNHIIVRLCGFMQRLPGIFTVHCCRMDSIAEDSVGLCSLAGARLASCYPLD